MTKSFEVGKRNDCDDGDYVTTFCLISIHMNVGFLYMVLQSLRSSL